MALQRRLRLLGRTVLILRQPQGPLRPSSSSSGYTACSSSKNSIRRLCATPLSTRPVDSIVADNAENSLGDRLLKRATLNPWNYVLVALEHPLLKGPVSMDQVYDLMAHIREISGKDFKTGIRDTWEWCNQRSEPEQRMPFPDVSLKSLASNSSPEYRIMEQIINAHVNAAHVKYRYARGRYAGPQSIANGWRMDVDRVRLLRAMVFNAFFGKKGGVLLNLLLDSGFSRSQFHKALPARLRGQYSFVSANLFRNMVVDAKAIYDRIAVPSEKGVFDALWQTNNIDAGAGLISELVVGKEVGENKHFDSAVVALCLNLMQVARMCNEHERTWEIFRICRPWVKRSTSAYNILMYADAKACNLSNVIYVLRNMKASGALPNSVTWTTIISGMCMSNRLEGAKKLFALHLDSLPYPKATATDGKAADGPQGNASGDDDGSMLYAPIMDMVGPKPNLWQQWYIQNNRSSKLDMFISMWIKEIASEYHSREEEAQILASKAVARGRGGVSRQGQQAAGDLDKDGPRYIVPWMPTLATHQIILKTLAREMKTQEAIQYFNLLKSVWPQYGKWAMVKRHATQFVDPSDRPGDTGGGGGGDSNPVKGLRSLERILYGHLAEHRSDVRKLYGLDTVEPPSDVDDPALARFYPSHCQKILEMICRIGSGPGPLVDPSAKSTVRVEKLLYAKSLHAHALEGDMLTLLHHMQRYPMLNDIGVWTSVVRCICVQVLNNPDEQHILYPTFDLSGVEHLVPQSILCTEEPQSWATFVLVMACVMSSKGVHFTQVTFGTAIHTAAKVGDLKSILHIIEFMRSYSNVPFNVDMLRMVVAQESSFERKCGIIRTFLSASANAGGEPDGLVLGRRSTVNVDSKLLTYVVRLMQQPEDLPALHDIVDVFAKEHGLQLGEMDYRYIIIKCQEFGMQNEASQWIRRLTSQYATIS
ncbi:hypothetical protein LPJ75_002156 [Coemansia sp. RSA 2598]|nr:hypothetical protein LPJ75_002156 [Coemansia sp. RSA 2598]